MHKFPISYHDRNFYVTIYDILPMSHSTIHYICIFTISLVAMSSKLLQTAYKIFHAILSGIV